MSFPRKSSYTELTVVFHSTSKPISRDRLVSHTSTQIFANFKRQLIKDMCYFETV